MVWFMHCCGGRDETTPCMLEVTLVGASGLQAMNAYCTCQLLDRHRAVEHFTTATERNTSRPAWNERFVLEQFRPGFSIELKIYNSNMSGATAVGTILLRSNEFWPDGLQGDVAILEVPHAFLSVSILPTSAKTPINRASTTSSGASIISADSEGGLTKEGTPRNTSRTSPSTIKNGCA
eukprot:TRINITY_DN7137_c0_g2_i1.p1 TRINITY_DN7137_c0_g2~~TRINITY_DN7137_c0_g2_i1.p1  ORF type:complete len:192 (-),score=15.92 TRINITY_DN7137_c0_g2_i1:18-554(-)